MVSVVFLHPDLGIGGAERLVVDAALALQYRGYKARLLEAELLYIRLCLSVLYCFTQYSYFSSYAQLTL